MRGVWRSGAVYYCQVDGPNSLTCHWIFRSCCDRETLLIKTGVAYNPLMTGMSFNPSAWRLALAFGTWWT